MGPINDHLQKGLRVLFVGFNPSLRSGLTGHHYANPNNRFYKVLYLAQLTPRLFTPEEDGKLLESGYGFTNIVARPTKTAAEITKDEYREGREILKEKIKYYQPRLVCFVGKGVYEQYSQRTSIKWGVQSNPVVPGVLEFVAPSTSGLVRMKAEEIAAIFQEIKKWIA